MLKKRYFKTKGEYDVTFSFPSDADAVSLVCEANNWEPIEMKKSKGVFSTKVRIPADGRYQYRYLVDGSEWANDEAADDYVSNEHGTTASQKDSTWRELRASRRRGFRVEFSWQ